jgi:signal transduction histidine kinase/ActR/RegA family two-component response regulator
MSNAVPSAESGPLQGIVDRFPLGIALLDAEGCVVYLNEASRTLLAIRRESDPELLGRPLNDHPCFQDSKSFPLLVDALLEGRSLDFEWPKAGANADCHDQVLRLRSLPLEDGSSNGGVQAALVIEDVSDSVRLKRHLGQAQRMESVGSLASAVAHDFNNILTAILGSVHLMKEGVESDGPLMQPLKTIEQTALSAGQLAEQLLTLARSRGSEPRDLSVNSVILESKTLLDRVLKEDIEVNLDLDEKLWCVRADPTQILHTLVNLCLNAQEAMDSVGVITVATRNVERSGEPRFEADLDPGQYVVLSVTDEGPGIAADVAERVFDPFFTTKEGGTGLGLSTAYTFAREQGGTATIYSETGEGTTIKVYMKAEPWKPAISDSEECEPAEDLTGEETILLVDDEAILLELGREILSRQGYNVIVADSGEAALALHKARKEPIPLAILDMAMPGLSGLETIRELRTRDPGMRIILSSGFHPSSRMEHLLGTDVDAFVNKPYEIKVLAREVRRLLDKPCIPDSTPRARPARSA